MDSETEREIALTYASLGQRKRSGNAIHHWCWRWRNPIMSPYVIPIHSADQKELARVAAFFRKHPARYPYDTSNYFNLVGVNRKHSFVKMAQSSGWVLNPSSFTVNIWRRPLPLKLDKRFHLTIGSYSDRAIFRDFRATMMNNFNSKPKFLRELNAMIRGIEPRLKTVLIHHESGRLAGAGLVTTQAGRAFLFCGSIEKRYRQRGLWKVLVGARQLASQMDGAHFWIMTTKNPFILGKGDESYPMLSFSRDESGPKT